MPRCSVGDEHYCNTGLVGWGLKWRITGRQAERRQTATTRQSLFRILIESTWSWRTLPEKRKQQEGHYQTRIRHLGYIHKFLPQMHTTYIPSSRSSSFWWLLNDSFLPLQAGHICRGILQCVQGNGMHFPKSNFSFTLSRCKCIESAVLWHYIPNLQMTWCIDPSLGWTHIELLTVFQTSIRCMMNWFCLPITQITTLNWHPNANALRKFDGTASCFVTYHIVKIDITTHDTVFVVSIRIDDTYYCPYRLSLIDSQCPCLHVIKLLIHEQ